MLIKEYRIPLPMSVEEYRIAQLYMIQVICVWIVYGGILFALFNVVTFKSEMYFILYFEYTMFSYHHTNLSTTFLIY